MTNSEVIIVVEDEEHIARARAHILDTLGIEPRAFRMRSGCDTTTPCALCSTCKQAEHVLWKLDDPRTRAICMLIGRAEAAPVAGNTCCKEQLAPSCMWREMLLLVLPQLQHAPMRFYHQWV